MLVYLSGLFKVYFKYLIDDKGERGVGGRENMAVHVLNVCLLRPGLWEALLSLHWAFLRSELRSIQCVCVL